MTIYYIIGFNASHKILILYISQERKTAIDNYLAKSMEKNSPVAAMLDPSFDHEPFDMREVAYSMIGQHCVTTV